LTTSFPDLSPALVIAITLFLLAGVVTAIKAVRILRPGIASRIFSLRLRWKNKILDVTRNRGFV
jgi:hypothetical protein